MEKKDVFKPKLNPEKVLAIRKELAEGATAFSLGKKYGVYASTIDKIRKGQTWRNVK